MNQDQVYAELTKIFRDVFQDDSIFVIASTTAEDVTGWDSSAHVNLILAIASIPRAYIRISRLADCSAAR